MKPKFFRSSSAKYEDENEAPISLTAFAATIVSFHTSVTSLFYMLHLGSVHSR